MMTSQILGMLLIWSLACKAQELPINTMDISSINGLSQKSLTTGIDPKIRKALFNVLSRLEEKQNYEFDDGPNNAAPENAYTTSTNEATVAPVTVNRENVQPTPIFSDIKPPDDIRWEYISNGTIKQFDLGEVVNQNGQNVSFVGVTDDAEANADDGDDQTPSKKQEEIDMIVNPLEQEALFFQLSQQLANRLQSNINNSNNSNNKSREFKSVDFPPIESLLLEESAGMYRPPVLDYVKFMINNIYNRSNPAQDSVIQTDKNERKKKIVQKIREENSINPNSKKDNDKSVEIFQAPLVAAFTLEQDQYGLPRRVTPLDNFSKAYLNSMTKRLNQHIEMNSNNNFSESDNEEVQATQTVFRNAEDVQQASYLEEKKRRTQAELEEKLRDISKKKQELELQKEKYLLELEKRKKIKSTVVPSKQRQQLYNVSPPQNEFTSSGPIDFQRSVEFVPYDNYIPKQYLEFNPNQMINNKPNFMEFSPSKPNFLEYPPGSKVSYSDFPPRSANSKPSSSFSAFPPSAGYSPTIIRGNRNEPQRFVGNFEFPPTGVSRNRPEIFDFDHRPAASSNILYKPEIVDRQLQSLIYHSGIPTNAKYEDLNIVSKVLSLDHKGHKIKHRDAVLAESASHFPHAISSPYEMHAPFIPYTYHK